MEHKGVCYLSQDCRHADIANSHSNKDPTKEIPSHCEGKDAESNMRDNFCIPLQWCWQQQQKW